MQKGELGDGVMENTWYVRQINMPPCFGDDEEVKAISEITPRRGYSADGRAREGGRSLNTRDRRLL